MTGADETLARIDAELEQFVTWDGQTDDAASSTVADLDGDRGMCTFCGCDASDCTEEDHDYEPMPAPYPSGEYLIAREDLYQWQGYLTWPVEDDPCADEPGWGVAEVWQRDNDPEWWPEWLETGLILDQAVEAARKREINLGSMLGASW